MSMDRVLTSIMNMDISATAMKAISMSTVIKVRIKHQVAKGQLKMLNSHPMLIRIKILLFIELADPCRNPLMHFLNPCHNGGICSLDANFTFSCKCPPEWTGEYCNEGI